ncbi:MAG: hypothetical protein JWO69_1730 [Thermoleophilia bacterium]|nr:hypothetical protein [Thermoleophilia bacterium]
MTTLRFPATAGRSEGELWLTDDGLEFVPAFALDGDQLGLSWDGWKVSWPEVVGVERARGGQARVHYDGYARFHAVGLAGSLERFLAAVDARGTERVADDLAA